MARRNGDAVKVRRCRLCRCTDLQACEGGCWWVESNLCSTCRAKLDLMVEALHQTACSAVRRLFLNTYIGGQKTISRRFGDQQTHQMSDFWSGDYAKTISSDCRTALRVLRRLAAEGFVFEDQRRLCSAVRFRVGYDIHLCMVREVIQELQAEGVPFDDDWRRSRDG